MKIHPLLLGGSIIPAPGGNVWAVDNVRRTSRPQSNEGLRSQFRSQVIFVFCPQAFFGSWWTVPDAAILAWLSGFNQQFSSI